MGFFSKLKESLSRTRESLSGRMDELVTAYVELDDDFYEDLTDILIMADVGMKTTELAVNQLRKKCQSEKIGDPKQAREELKKILIDIMGSEPLRLESPMVLLVIGVNGVGKTTSIGKMASRMTVSYTHLDVYKRQVLDRYKQVYIGKSNNVKRRIQQHWSNTKAFDRTLLPIYAVDTSIFSIDFFRALDTTRIFIWENELQDGLERELIEDFPQQYRTNRIGGDISTYIEAILTRNKRNLR